MPVTLENDGRRVASLSKSGRSAAGGTGFQGQELELFSGEEAPEGGVSRFWGPLFKPCRGRMGSFPVLEVWGVEASAEMFR